MAGSRHAPRAATLIAALLWLTAAVAADFASLPVVPGRTFSSNCRAALPRAAYVCTPDGGLAVRRGEDITCVYAGAAPQLAYQNCQVTIEPKAQGRVDGRVVRVGERFTATTDGTARLRCNAPLPCTCEIGVVDKPH